MTRHLRTICVPVLMMQLCVGVAAASAEAPRISQGIDADAQLPYWEWQGDGLSVRLVQRLPDQTRGFFQARGFSAAQAELIAQSCVFQSIIRNIGPADGGGEVQLDLAQWRVQVAGRRQPLLLREHWAQVWAKQDVETAARIAFEWSLFPSTQTYAPGDYNWGMTLYGLDFGQRFDLEFNWKRNGVVHSGRLPGVECANDIHPEPTS